MAGGGPARRPQRDAGRRATVGAGCGHTDGGIPLELSHTGIAVSAPDCARDRRDGTNEIDGIRPAIALDWTLADRTGRWARRARSSGRTHAYARWMNSPLRCVASDIALLTGRVATDLIKEFSFMGLAEKRVQQDFEQKRMPKRLAEFKSNHCPKAQLVVEFDWVSFEGDKPALDNLWGYWEQGFQGLESVCSDDLGKDAVADGVKKLLIRNAATKDEIGAELKEGVLVVRSRFKDGASGTPGWTAVRKAIEAGL